MSTRKISPIKPEQVVLISAGASGIGRAIAETFIAHDFRTHVFDINSDAISSFLKRNPGASGTTDAVHEITARDCPVHTQT